MLLSDLPLGVTHIVECVRQLESSDRIAVRLRDLGFVAGEPIRVIARGPWGADPVLIQIGATRFALRRAEAQRVVVCEVSHAS